MWAISVFLCYTIWQIGTLRYPDLELTRYPAFLRRKMFHFLANRKFAKSENIWFNNPGIKAANFH